MTKDYDNVNIKNFSTSWSDGLAFAALLHKTYPDCIDYAALSADDPATTLAEAFRVAEEVFDIPVMLDVENKSSVYLSGVSGLLERGVLVCFFT
jgi:hypothetical protein